MKVLEKYLLYIGFALSLLMHAPFLNRPPESHHVWRQCNTLAVARNFYEEDMNIFRPRVDQRYDSDGVTGMQFPAYEYIVALGYHVFGEQFWVHRLTSLLILFGGAFAMFHLVLIISDNKLAAAVGGWAFLWSPELFYHGINALPDVLALSASLGGFALFLKWFQKQAGGGYLAAALALLMLAGLTKLQYLAVGFPIAVLVLKEFDQLRKQIPLAVILVVFGLLAVAPALAWYGWYAPKLIAESGLLDFGLELRPAGSIGEALQILFANLVVDIPETLLNYATTALVVLGMVAGVKFRKKFREHRYFMPVLLWSVGLLAYHLIELSQMRDHEYYLLPEIPVFILIAAAGAWWLRKSKNGTIALAILVVLMPVLAGLRMIPARWLNEHKQVPVELYEADSRARLRAAVPDDAHCVVGPDVSSCIYFYFLHKKGSGFSEGKLLSGQTDEGALRIKQYVESGAEFLYTSDPAFIEHPEVRPFIGEKILAEGSFSVYRLVVAN